MIDEAALVPVVIRYSVAVCDCTMAVVPLNSDATVVELPTAALIAVPLAAAHAVVVDLVDAQMGLELVVEPFPGLVISYQLLKKVLLD